MLYNLKNPTEFTVNRFKKSYADGVDNVKNKWLTIFFTDCAIWPQLQMINFAFVPPHLQAVYVNVLNVFWNAFICYVSQGGH